VIGSKMKALGVVRDLVRLVVMAAGALAIIAFVGIYLYSEITTGRGPWSHPDAEPAPEPTRTPEVSCQVVPGPNARTMDKKLRELCADAQRLVRAQHLSK